MKNSIDPKFRPAEDVISAGNPGEPGYTIVIIRRTGFNMMTKNHTWRITVTPFSGASVSASFTSVVQARKYVNAAVEGRNVQWPDVMTTGF